MRAENIYEICYAVLSQILLSHPNTLVLLMDKLRKYFGKEWFVMSEKKWSALIEKVAFE